jgi:hypothetical protein
VVQNKILLPENPKEEQNCSTVVLVSAANAKPSNQSNRYMCRIAQYELDNIFNSFFLKKMVCLHLSMKE